ncbi:MAG: DUF4783 domain-containing protein [Bacteroidota bacterium]
MNLRKKLIIPTILILSLLSLTAERITGQTVSAEVKNAFQTANAAKLSNYFGHTLTLNIPGTDIQCSREEAKDKMTVFFNEHKINAFEIKFKGEKDNSNFLIGTLFTNKATYRVNLFFRKSEGKNYIHLLRIDEEHESEF